MAKIPAKLRLAKKLEGDANKALDILDDAYLDIAPNLNRKTDMIIENNDDPTTGDVDHDIGTLWLNRDVSGVPTPKLYILTDLDETASPRTATWTQII